MSTDGDEDASDGEEGGRWAADEPTAMWDESMMRDAGFDALADDRSAKPRVETGPATQREVRGDDASKVGVSRELTGGHPAVRAAPPPAKSSALSWVITGVLAIALGVGAYFLVRFLR